MPSGLGAIFDRGLNTALERRFLIRDDLGFNMMPELAAVVPIDSPELQFHLGWRKWQVSRHIAAVAAQAARFQVRMPDASAGGNSIAILEGVSVGVPSTTTITASFGYGPGNVDLGTVVSGANMPRDGRQGQGAGQVGSSLVTSLTTSAALLANFGLEVLCPANVTTALFPPMFPFIMVPGNSLLFGAATVNQDVTFILTFRERMLNDGEAAA